VADAFVDRRVGPLAQHAPASACAASTYTGSFSNVRAWSGVFERDRRTVHAVRAVASKFMKLGRASRASTPCRSRGGAHPRRADIVGDAITADLVFPEPGGW
jgi:hypothetical protein